MADHILQHLADSKAHAVVLLPDVKAYRFALVQLATVRSIAMAPPAAAESFQWSSPDGSLRIGGTLAGG